MKPFQSWAISSDNTLVIDHPDGTVTRFNLNIWTKEGARFGGIGTENRLMTPEEVALVCGDILFKCGWPFDRPEGTRLTLTQKADGQVVAVSLQDDDSTIRNLLWLSKPIDKRQEGTLLGGPGNLLLALDSVTPEPPIDRSTSANSAPHPGQITFSVNTYDADGDCFEKGVFLHFGPTRVCVAENPQEFVDQMASRMQKIANEIAETYNLKTGRPK
jgi:hypothetical protein